jgi:hypothetical protein
MIAVALFAADAIAHRLRFGGYLTDMRLLGAAAGMKTVCRYADHWVRQARRERRSN